MMRDSSESELTAVAVASIVRGVDGPGEEGLPGLALQAGISPVTADWSTEVRRM